MAATGTVAVNCYWNGRVKKEQNDVVYEGAKVNVLPIKVFHGTTYAGLLDKIYGTTAIDREKFELNIICRYPISSREYKPIPIKNDEGVELMLEMPSRSGVYCVEIYLDMEEEPAAPLRAEPIALLTKETKALEVGDHRNNNGKPSSKLLSNDSPQIDHGKKVLIWCRRKWEELNMDCLVQVFQKVGMEALLLDVPFVCKSWYEATLNPKCWQHLIFPENFFAFAERVKKEYQREVPITSFIKSMVNRSSRCATTLMLPHCSTEEALEYAAKHCPALRDFGLHGYLSHKNARVVLKVIKNWKNLEVLRLRRAHDIKELVREICIHCNNFYQLMLPESYVWEDVAYNIVTCLPKIRHLFLKGGSIERRSLVMILQRCKEVVKLDVRDCFLFEENDGEILELASHIPSFSCQGSTNIDNYEDREVHIGLCICDSDRLYWDPDVPYDWNFVS